MASWRDRESRRRKRIMIRALIVNAKDVPCLDCGRRYPTCVMEFDHVRGEKHFELSEAGRGSKGKKDRNGKERKRKAGSSSLVAVRDEILKCDVVCANCHRLRTFNGNHHLRNHVEPIDDHPELF